MPGKKQELIRLPAGVKWMDFKYLTKRKMGSLKMVRRFSEEEIINKRHSMKLVHEGQYIAEVDINLIEEETGWAPYLSLENVQKLHEVRQALRRGDIKSASRLARVYTLTPVAV